jgi:hypothetical protein
MTEKKTPTGAQGKIHAILMNLSQDEQKLLNAVITAERLDKQKPCSITDDLWKALTAIIR